MPGIVIAASIVPYSSGAVVGNGGDVFPGTPDRRPAPGQTPLSLAWNPLGHDSTIFPSPPDGDPGVREIREIARAAAGRRGDVQPGGDSAIGAGSGWRGILPGPGPRPHVARRQIRGAGRLGGRGPPRRPDYRHPGDNAMNSRAYKPEGAPRPTQAMRSIGKLYGGRKVETRRRVGRERSVKRLAVRLAAGLCRGGRLARDYRSGASTSAAPTPSSASTRDSRSMPASACAVVRTGPTAHTPLRRHPPHVQAPLRPHRVAPRNTLRTNPGTMSGTRAAPRQIHPRERAC